jgi:phosphotransferase system IIB component
MANKKIFNNIAEDILEYVGGKENVTSVAQCATRLRFVLHDDKKINFYS